MTAFTYTAQEDLVTGHSQGSSYTIDVRCAARELSPDVLKSQPRALSGKTETLLWYSKRSWSITTGSVRRGDLDLVQELLSSVVGGAVFQFDEFGSAGAPENPINVILDGLYKKVRSVRQGDGGRDDYFRFSFNIRTP